MGTEHLLLGLIKLGQGVAVNVLQKMGLDLETVRMEVEKQVGSGPETKMVGNIPYTPRVKKVLALAGKEAKIAEPLLRRHRAHPARPAARGRRRRRARAQEPGSRYRAHPQRDPQGTRPEFHPAGSRAGTRRRPTAASKKDVKTPALRAFGRDLTELAKKGELDPVIGRKNEIERVIQILCRRTKNNPVLLGEAGVGKTAIVEGLAQEIAGGNVPGTAARQEGHHARPRAHGRRHQVPRPVRGAHQGRDGRNPPLEERHPLHRRAAHHRRRRLGRRRDGRLATSSSPRFSRGELQCVGATTLNEYRKYIEKDAALERRFQTVKVEAPSVEETIQILKGLRPKYEAHHKAQLTDEALEAAAKLSDRYLTGRFLPDKAIDVMDEAGARARIGVDDPPAGREGDREGDRDDPRREGSAPSRPRTSRKPPPCATPRSRPRKSSRRILTEWREQREEKEVVVTEDDIMHVVSKWTGVPLKRMEQKETAEAPRDGRAN